ncbi:hypothetical protein [Halalkalibacter okhensis]|uniref:PilZ domain-containing protein n=1 Tax=Halalkalibacter okhensis TaxID=333138 RepID=A0A0B0I870_9BACI|nr:hypothetical protein [Halalkalibacter okhensis]KHF38693.1 hypothetical protein LQ50_19650 [Halalkalibacter okhensis]
MENRLFPALNFHKPLSADVSIAELNGVDVNSSKTKVLVSDISSEGLSFSTNLDFPILSENSFILRVELFSKCTFTGEIEAKEERDGAFYYKLNVRTCNLLFYKLFDHMHNTHYAKTPVPYFDRATATG